jgi:hypothetical protein
MARHARTIRQQFGRIGLAQHSKQQRTLHTVGAAGHGTQFRVARHGHWFAITRHAMPHHQPVAHGRWQCKAHQQPSRPHRFGAVLDMVNLLIGMAMGLGILAAASTWTAMQWQSDRHTAQRSLAQQDIRALMDTLVHDIRRAQFRSQPQHFQVSPHQILFSINRNDNAQRDNNECSGFRLNGTALQTQTACQPVVWTSLNDSRTLQILSLNFEWSCDNNNGSLGDLLWLQITSQSPHEPTPSTWQRHVRMRNVHARLRPDVTTCNSAA